MMHLLAAILLAPLPLAAAQDTARPFVPGGVYDRPFTGRLLGRTAVGGYGEMHARWQRVDGLTEHAGFEMRRFNLFTATRVSDFVRIGAELEIEEGGEELKLEYAAMDVGVHPALWLRAGMILSPLGRFNLAHDSPRNEFTDRPLASTEIIGVALSEPGIGAFGLVPLGRSGRITYEVYAVNGFGTGVVLASSGTRIANGRGNFNDENSSAAWVGRLAVSAASGWEAGFSLHHGAWNVYSSEGAVLDSRRDLTIRVLDVEASPAGFRLQGELAQATIELPPGLAGIYASRQLGTWLEIARDVASGLVPTMPGSYVTLRARYDNVDFDRDIEGDAVARATVGATFRPTRDTALKLDYYRGRSRDRFNNAAAEAGLLFSVATYF